MGCLAELKTMPDFEPIAVAFKRVVNIIRKADPTEGLQVAPERFTTDCEKALHNALAAIVTRVDRHLAGGDYAAALRETAFLRTPVDAFFEGVLVMDEDARLRANRLALLRGVAALFDRFADFSRLSV